MNNYDDKEIGAMSNDELGKFLGITKKMLEKAKANQTKVKIALDHAQKLYERIDIDLQDNDSYDSWNPCPYSYADRKAAGKKVGKYQLKAKELSHEIFYLERTIGRTQAEVGIRSGVRGKVSSIIGDMFDEV